MPVRAGLRPAKLVTCRQGTAGVGLHWALETSAELKQAAQYNDLKTPQSEFPTRLLGTVKFLGQFFVVSG